MNPLTNRDIITICATVCVIIGWFINSIIQRRHEIAKERFKVRISILKDSLDLLSVLKTVEPTKHISYFASVEFKTLFLKADQNFTVYGTDKQINYWNKFAELIRKNNFNDAITQADIIIKELRLDIRKELRL